jgi:hypothetical protein
MKEHFYNKYKAWSAFTKSIRSQILKSEHKTFILNTLYLGKLYISKSENDLYIIY